MCHRKTMSSSKIVAEQRGTSVTKITSPNIRNGLYLISLGITYVVFTHKSFVPPDPLYLPAFRTSPVLISHVLMSTGLHQCPCHISYLIISMRWQVSPNVLIPLWESVVWVCSAYSDITVSCGQRCCRFEAFNQKRSVKQCFFILVLGYSWCWDYWTLESSRAAPSKHSQGHILSSKYTV